MPSIRYLYMLILPALLGGCATTGMLFDDRAANLEKPATELAEHQLLDVWIETFEPGELPADEASAQGLSIDIREAEARFIPIHLAETMEKTGYWGSVRVLPAVSEGGEILVKGRILSSDGGVLRLQVAARDATGREWFSRDYGLTLDPGAYGAQVGDEEVFQGLYNLIANDLAHYRNGLSAADLLQIRRVAEIRFARDLAPDAFSRYLQIDNTRQYSIVGLPAANDPMYQRILAIRERDFMLIDTLNGHFDNFFLEAQCAQPRGGGLAGGGAFRMAAQGAGDCGHRRRHRTECGERQRYPGEDGHAPGRDGPRRHLCGQDRLRQG